MHDVELSVTEPPDRLEYYVTETELGWMLVMRRGAKLSLTQHFASMRAAVSGGLTIRSLVDPTVPAAY